MSRSVTWPPWRRRCWPGSPTGHRAGVRPADHRARRSWLRPPASAAQDQPCSCGRVGCLETVANGSALVRQLQASHPSVASVEELTALVAQGDPQATTLVVREAGAMLGVTLSTVVNFANPHAVFLGGALSACDPFLAAVRGQVYAGCHPLVTRLLRVKPAPSGRNTTLVGINGPPRA